MPIAESLLIGIATNVLYDLLRGNISNELKNDISNVYNQTINELSKKYNKELAMPIKQIFRDSYIRHQIKEFKGGRIKIIDNVKRKAKDLVRNKYSNLPLNEIVPDFYSIFISKIRKNPQLNDRLKEAYNSVIMDNLLSIQGKLEHMNKDLGAIKDNLLNDIKDKMYIKLVKSAGFPKTLGGFQLKIIGQNISDFFQNMDNYAFEGKDGFTVRTELTKKEYAMTYYPKDSNNVIRLDYKGNPYKIIYPPHNAVDIWIKENKNLIEITCFTGSYNLHKELHKIFKNCAHSKVLFKEVTFNQNMKKLLKQHLGQITNIEYDPLIWGKIEINNIEYDLVADHATISGEKGIMKHPKIEVLIKSLKKIRPGQVADIYYFKTEESAKFDGKYNTSFDVNHDGRIIAFFNKKKYSDNDMKDSIYNFIIKNGLEE